MAVPVAISVATAIEDHCVVKQRAIPFGGRVKFLQEVCQLLRVEDVDFTDLRLLRLVTAVMRQVVMAFRDVDKRIRFITTFVCQHKRLQFGLHPPEMQGQSDPS